MIYRLFILVLIAVLHSTSAHASKMGAMSASLTTYAPNPPTISAAVASSTSVTISKTADGTVDGLHSVATGYDLYRTAANGAVDSESLWQSDISFPYTDTALTTGATYRYKVRSKNAAGSSATYSNEVSATPTAAPTAPGAPTGVTATAGNAQATVTFTAPASNGGSAITGYTVTSNPAGGTDSNGGSTSLTHTVTGLTNGTAYTFTVTATNSVGPSSPSSASNSVTPSAGTVWDMAGTAGTTTVSGITLTTASGGTAQLDGSGRLVLTTSADSGVAMGAIGPYTVSTRTYTVRGKVTTLGTGKQMMVAGLRSKDTVPNGDNPGYMYPWIQIYNNGGTITLLLAYIDPDGATFHYWTGSTWTTTAGGPTVALNTDYDFIIDETATQFRLTVKKVSDSSTVAQTPLMNWTDSYVPRISTNEWLVVGDVWSAVHNGAYSMDSVTIQ